VPLLIAPEALFIHKHRFLNSPPNPAPRSGWACDDPGKRDQGERLSERNAVKRVRARPPLFRGSTGCPKRSAGTQTAGRLFFGDFLLAKQKKVTCRRATPGQPNQAKPTRYQLTSYPRNTHKRQSHFSSSIDAMAQDTSDFQAVSRPATHHKQKTYPRFLCATLWITMFTSRQTRASAGFADIACGLTSGPHHFNQTTLFYQ